MEVTKDTFSKVDEFNLITQEVQNEVYDYIKAVLVSANGSIKKDNKEQGILEASWRYGVNFAGLRVTVKFRKINDDKIEINFRGGFKDSFDTTGVGSKKANEIINMVIGGVEVESIEETNINSNTEDIYIPSRGKSKTLAGVLALVVGGLGLHKFYLGNYGWGIVYLVSIFVLPLASAIIGAIEGIRIFTLSEKSFDEKYNHISMKPFTFVW